MNPTTIETVKTQMIDILNKYYSRIEGTMNMNIQATIKPPPPIEGKMNMDIVAKINQPPPIVTPQLNATINIDVDAVISDDKLDSWYTDPLPKFHDLSDDDLTATVNIDAQGIIAPPKIAELKDTVSAEIRAEIPNDEDSSSSSSSSSSKSENNDKSSFDEDSEDNGSTGVSQLTQSNLTGEMDLNVNAIVAKSPANLKGKMDLNVNATVAKPVSVNKTKPEELKKLLSSKPDENSSGVFSFSDGSPSTSSKISSIILPSMSASTIISIQAKLEEPKKAEPKQTYDIINTHFELKQLEPTYIETRDFDKESKLTTIYKSSYQLVFPSITFELIANTGSTSSSSSSSSKVYLIAGTITNTDKKKKSRDKITHYFIKTSDTEEILYTLKQNPTDKTKYDFIKDIDDAQKLYANILENTTINIPTYKYTKFIDQPYTLLDVSGFITYYGNIGNQVFDASSGNKYTIKEKYVSTKQTEPEKTTVQIFNAQYKSVGSDFTQIKDETERENYKMHWFNMHTVKDYQKRIYELFAVEYSHINPIVNANQNVKKSPKKSPNDPIRNTFSNLTILKKYIDKIIALPLKGTTVTEYTT
jgi:hypothetical protein